MRKFNENSAYNSMNRACRQIDNRSFLSRDLLANSVRYIQIGECHYSTNIRISVRLNKLRTTVYIIVRGYRLRSCRSYFKNENHATLSRLRNEFYFLGGV